MKFQILISQIYNFFFLKPWLLVVILVMKLGLVDQKNGGMPKAQRMFFASHHIVREKVFKSPFLD